MFKIEKLARGGGTKSRFSGVCARTPDSAPPRLLPAKFAPLFSPLCLISMPPLFLAAEAPRRVGGRPGHAVRQPGDDGAQEGTWCSIRSPPCRLTFQRTGCVCSSLRMKIDFYLTGGSVGPKDRVCPKLKQRVAGAKADAFPSLPNPMPFPSECAWISRTSRPSPHRRE